MKSAPTIAFDIRPSRILTGLIVLVVMLAMVGVVASGLDPRVKFIGVVVVALLSAQALRKQLRRIYRRVARDASGWQLVRDHDESVPAKLGGHTRLGPLIVIEFLLSPGQRFHCLLTPDVIDAESRRRLLLVLASEPKNRGG